MPNNTVVEHLMIKQGTDWARGWPIYDETGAPLDLAGAQAAAQVRDRDGNLLADLNPQIDTENHQITIEVKAPATLLWSWRFGLFDLSFTDSNGNVYPVVEGNVRVRPAVTHA